MVGGIDMKTIEERAKEYVSKKHIDCGNCDTCVKCPDYWTYISIAKEQKAIDEGVRLKKCDEKNRKHKLTIIEFAKFGDFNSWVKYRADEKVLTFMGRFEQDENGMYLHTHIFDDGTEITFNF